MRESWEDNTRTGESLIVLTYDETLVQTLEAVAPEHALSVIDSETDLPTQLIGQQAGVAILDTDAVSTPIAQLTTRLRAQFPDLVLIVAGNARDQQALSAQVQRGTVYRFLHKPVSAQRVKAFVDAAWRRHGQEQALEQSQAVSPRRKPIMAPPQSAEPRMSRATLFFGAAALVASIVFVLWLAFRPDGLDNTRTAGTSEQIDTALKQILAQADAAFNSGAYVSPPGQNAVELYRRALERDPASVRAREGINRVVGQLLENAEQEIVAERLDEAARLVASAREVQPDNARVAFLTAQIAKERERALLTKAQQEAQSGNVNRALEVLTDAERSGGGSTLMTEARQQIEQKDLENRITELLRRADARARSGALTTPDQDNAQYFIDSAAALAPESARVLRAKQDLMRRVLTQARTVLVNGNNSEGDRLLTVAATLGATQDDVATVRREAQNARIAARADFMARMSQLFNQRLVEGTLLEPQTDSAQFYLTQLEQADANHPSTIMARQALSARLLAEARSAIAKSDLTTAQAYVLDARKLGVSPIDASAVEREIAAARTPVRKEPAVVSANSLERLKYVAPQYPSSALARNRSGWVELEFTVRADGSVTDIVVVGSDPPQIFDQAAVDAVRKWRYKPVERNGRPVDLRAKLRVRFALE